MKNEPSNPKKENRTERIDIRLTDSEYAEILAGMEDSPYTTKGAYMRAKLLNTDSPMPTKNRYLAILAAGKLRDSIKGIARDVDIFTKAIETKKNNLKASDKQQIGRIKELVTSIMERIQNAEL